MYLFLELRCTRFSTLHLTPALLFLNVPIAFSNFFLLCFNGFNHSLLVVFNSIFLIRAIEIYIIVIIIIIIIISSSSSSSGTTSSSSLLADDDSL